MGSPLLPSPLPAAPPLSPSPIATLPDWASRASTQTPHLPPRHAQGLAGGQLPDGDFEVRTGWAATARGFLKTPVSVQGAAADWATLRALAVPPTGHSHSGPGRQPLSQGSADRSKEKAHIRNLERSDKVEER